MILCRQYVISTPNFGNATLNDTSPVWNSARYKLTTLDADWYSFFIRNHEVELRLKGRGWVPSLSPHAALQKENGGGNGTARRCDVVLWARKGWGFLYDSLRSTILVRHANVEGEDRSPRRVLLSRSWSLSSSSYRSERHLLVIGLVLVQQSTYRERVSDLAISFLRSYVNQPLNETSAFRTETAWTSRACERSTRAIMGCPTSHRVTLKG